MKILRFDGWLIGEGGRDFNGRGARLPIPPLEIKQRGKEKERKIN